MPRQASRSPVLQVAIPVAHVVAATRPATTTPSTSSRAVGGRTAVTSANYPFQKVPHDRAPHDLAVHESSSQPSPRHPAAPAAGAACQPAATVVWLAQRDDSQAAGVHARAAHAVPSQTWPNASYSPESSSGLPGSFQS